MAYRIAGIDPAPFATLFGADDATLAAHGARRIVADTHPGFPCRVTLEDAAPGESLILVHHVSHDVSTPYRAAYAIFLREGATAPAEYRDAVPPVMRGRTLGLRAFDRAGMLRGAALAMPGAAATHITALLDDADIAYIDAHNAAHGCFVARIERGAAA